MSPQYTSFRYEGRRLWTSGGRQRAARGVGLAAEYLLGESKLEVPLDEGTLERSGRADVDESRLRASVSYDTVYAVPQHERMDYRHAPGRKAKYLEDPMNRSREVVAQIIAAELRRWTSS